MRRLFYINNQEYVKTRFTQKSRIQSKSKNLSEPIWHLYDAHNACHNPIYSILVDNCTILYQQVFRALRMRINHPLPTIQERIHHSNREDYSTG